MKCLLVALLLSASAAFAQDTKQDDLVIIRGQRMASNAAIARHDLEGITKYWLPDFVQTRGSGTSLTGKDTITATWKALFSTDAAVVYVRTPMQIILGANDIMAWETGVWVQKNSSSYGGNYSAMWRKVNGEWKLQAELFVSLK